MAELKRDERGRVAQRVPGKYSDKVFACRVTESEMALIRKARKMGIDVRGVLLSEIRKRVHDESAE
jgi:hypothetical protein